MRITPKSVQVHFECICGFNQVNHDTLLIRWKDLSKAGIKRKKGWLFTHIKSTQCLCSTAI